MLPARWPGAALVNASRNLHGPVSDPLAGEWLLGESRIHVTIGKKPLFRMMRQQASSISTQYVTAPPPQIKEPWQGVLDRVGLPCSLKFNGHSLRRAALACRSSR